MTSFGLQAFTTAARIVIKKIKDRIFDPADKDLIIYLEDHDESGGVADTFKGGRCCS